MTLFVEKFSTNSLFLGYTAYGFLFRQNPQGYFLPLVGFQLGGGARSLIHAFFEEIIGNFPLSRSFLNQSNLWDKCSYRRGFFHQCVTQI
jgi:hypothetical protein